MNASAASQSKRREENCTGMHSRELRNQSGEYHLHLSESNTLETQFTFPYDIVNQPGLLKVQVT